MKTPKNKIKHELTKLWTGELVAVISFWICLFIFKKWLISTKMLISVIYQLAVLSLILIQGSIYWLILLKRLSTPQFAVTNTKKIYSILKIVDFILLCLGIPIIILNYVNVTVMISAIFILAFAVIEWINYYKIRLSYSYNPLVLLRRIKNRKLPKGRLAKEISDR
ncbi:hypothetical protein HMPREF1987_02010 [Peptostreptococcaceae bacterium oral taxon 113 str. W5053]|nr:hypothetical protein HMPREF1987_02010 [Peptostreptococcaceae bacterium oral taxon 113 str. W5053]